MNYKRWQEENLREALKTWRVVLLVGPRQCGKTTLSRLISSKNSENVEYRTLDDKTLRTAAELDPLGFVTTTPGRETLIIDEVQKVPELLSAVKQVVDEDNRPGQFLLTGSAHVQSLPTVQESLTGRVGRIRLRTLAQGEIRGLTPAANFIRSAFEGEFKGLYDETFDREKLLDLAFKGGFPEVLRLPEGRIRSWHRDYLRSLIERDLVDISHIRKTDELYDLIEIMASWSSKYTDISAIGSSLSLTRKTLESYLTALELLFLVETVAPWAKTDYGRVGKQKKSFITDTGLIASLLGWSRKDLWLDSDRIGKLIESLVYQELTAQIDYADGRYRLYHYRDREKREIDFLIEDEDRSLVGIEVKAGLTVSKQDIKHMVWFAENISPQPFRGVVLYAGSTILSLSKNMWAIPLSALWG
jgi:uncharacterized protein